MRRYNVDPTNRGQVLTFLYFPDDPPEVLPPETEMIVNEILGHEN